MCAAETLQAARNEECDVAKLDEKAQGFDDTMTLTVLLLQQCACIAVGLAVQSKRNKRWLQRCFLKALELFRAGRADS